MFSQLFELSPDCIKIRNDTLYISFYDLGQDNTYDGGIGIYSKSSAEIK